MSKVTPQSKVFNVITSLRHLPNVTVELKHESEYEEFIIKHDRVFVPDFRFQWCSGKEHFRVYIRLASSTRNKADVGYPICVIKSSLTAAAFVTVYHFLHKHRSNNKDKESQE